MVLDTLISYPLDPVVLDETVLVVPSELFTPPGSEGATDGAGNTVDAVDSGG
ncbi:MAG: hypothetical protein ACFCVK_16270 [Acidimicrobiales bacterium]